MDHQETYLRTALGFMGLTDISFVRAEGLLRGAEASEEAFKLADQQIADAIEKVDQLDTASTSHAS
jgi:FMN-dependent NADH-azoreductase